MAQTQLLKLNRQEKEEEADLRAKIREQYLYECPKSSAEKTAAEVFKRLAEHKLKIKQGEVASLNTADETFKPRLATSLKKNIEKYRVHDGAWSLDPEDGKGFWSCCRSEEFRSDGCIEKVRNKDRWITISS